MNSIAIELCARRAADVASLRRVAEALERQGVRTVLCRAPGADLPDSPGIPPSGAREAVAARVIVETGEGRPVAAPVDGTPLVVLWESCAPVERLGPEGRVALARLDAARLVLVPGAAQARSLGLRTGAELEVTGIARLDPAGAGLGSPREEARRALGLPAAARVVLYVPSAAPDEPFRERIGEALCELCAPDRIVVVLARDARAPWLDLHRRWAAARAGLLVLESDEPSQALLACDVVAGAPEGLLFEGRALGIPTVCLGDEPMAGGTGATGIEGAVVARGAGDLAAAVGRALVADPASLRCDPDLLKLDGGAASRIAARIAALVVAPTTATGGSIESASELFARIEAQAAFGNAEEAAGELRRYLAARPSADGFALLCSIERRRGQLEAAEAAGDRAVELGHEGASRALCERARIDVERGEFARARGLFEQAARLAPALSDPLVGMGSLELHDGQGQQAEGLFRQALALEKSARAWSGLGLALVAQTRYRDALPALEAALDVDPECQAALFGLVQAAFQTGELATAAVRLERFIDAHPGNLDFTFTLAGLRGELGERERARELLERIEVFDAAYPGLADLREKLGL